MSEFRRVLVEVALDVVVAVGFVVLVLPFKAVAASADGLAG